MYFGEIGNDPDEEGSLLFQVGLVKRGFISLEGVIANRNPALERAQVARGTLDALGQSQVAVAVGMSYGPRQSNEETQFDVPYKSTQTDFPKGNEWFWSSLEKAEDRSLGIVCASGLTDIADLLKRNTKEAAERSALLQVKVRCASIMGGVEEKNGLPILDDLGFLVPTWAATNNSHDWMAAEYAYAALQRLHIPTIVISKWSAYAASTPRDAYDVLAETGHPVGIRLQRMQEAMIQHLWMRANLNPHDPARDGLPSMLGKAWFSKTFCGGKDLSKLGGGDRIWNEILVFNLYDQTAVMAVLSELCLEHFSPVRIGSYSDFQVIGVNQANHNVRDPGMTSRFLIETMLAGLR